MRDTSVGSYTRINKRKARRLFFKGENIYVIPHKMSPEGPWGAAMEINEKILNDQYAYEGKEKQFDTFIKHFEFYNCDYERGYYPSFYLKKEE